MKLTRQQKVGFAVIAIGAGAVLVDRFFLLGPAQASAGTLVTATDVQVNTSEFRQGGPGRMPLTLAMTNQPQPVSDALKAIRQRWSLEAQDADAGFPAPATQSPATAPHEAAPVAVLIPELTVTSMLDGTHPLAVINGRAYNVGDELLGVRVVRISGGRVVFQQGDHLFEIAVERQARQSGG